MDNSINYSKYYLRLPLHSLLREPLYLFPLDFIRWG